MLTCDADTDKVVVVADTVSDLPAFAAGRPATTCLPFMASTGAEIEVGNFEQPDNRRHINAPDAALFVTVDIGTLPSSVFVRLGLPRSRPPIVEQEDRTTRLVEPGLFGHLPQGRNVLRPAWR